MTKAAPKGFRTRNPDVLTCIANLSNDEVFTPPELAGRMLDTLAVNWAKANDGADIWADSTLTFLDPFTKSGVFLREIVKRLTEGLQGEIPDLRDRVNHIVENQVFGIGITELTSLLARRSVYCSKWANGEHSVGHDVFDTESGNIWFERLDHTWENDKCVFCGASKSTLDRGDDRESHAYAFIHTDNIEARVAEIFGASMKFDVIVGNPPYQLDTGGSGRQARPIYNLFVEQAMKLEPRMLCMVIQSRWFGGGMGLTEFRSRMLNDRRLRALVDYTNSNEVFAGTDFGGGVCYFLWDAAYDGDCEVVNNLAGERYVSTRALNEFPHFIRYAPAVPIVRKVMEAGGASLKSKVSGVRPFGIPTSARPSGKGPLILITSGGTGPSDESVVTAGHDLVEKWKVLTSKTSHDHAGLPDRDGSRRVLSRLEVIPPQTVCSESYIVVGRFDTEDEAENCAAYLRTRLVRFLLSLLSYSQDITSERFHLVPDQDFSSSWSDEALYEKYELTAGEIAFVEKTIRPMPSANE